MSPLLAAVIPANTVGLFCLFVFVVVLVVVLFVFCFVFWTQCFIVQRLVAAHFVTIARFVTMVTKRAGIASIAASFVTNEVVRNRAGNVHQ